MVMFEVTETSSEFRDGDIEVTVCANATPPMNVKIETNSNSFFIIVPLIVV